MRINIFLISAALLGCFSNGIAHAKYKILEFHVEKLLGEIKGYTEYQTSIFKELQEIENSFRTLQQATLDPKTQEKKLSELSARRQDFMLNQKVFIEKAFKQVVGIIAREHKKQSADLSIIRIFNSDIPLGVNVARVYDVLIGKNIKKTEVNRIAKSLAAKFKYSSVAITESQLEELSKAFKKALKQ